ncbi:MAG: phosphate ABC transporter permease PstA [Acidobacteriota bacterium]|nr:phosphate ABC transporter permease PstA [Acidobacteriota bacterium]
MTRGKRSFSELVGITSTALCGGALALCLLLVAGLLGLLLYHGMGYFWQSPVVQLTLTDESVVAGEIVEREVIPAEDDSAALRHRIRLMVGNRDLTGHDFVWIDESRIARMEYPADLLLVERLEWGKFYGRLLAISAGEQTLAGTPQAARAAWPRLHARKKVELEKIHRLEKRKIGEVNREIENFRLELRRLDMEGAAPDDPRRADIQRNLLARRSHYEELADRLAELRRNFLREELVMEAADGTLKPIPAGHVVRMVRANTLSAWGRLKLYVSRSAEFLLGEPRESNTEGGVFPAIFGTVMMVFLMSFAVSPLGVLAAIYLREYAREGLLVKIVRIAVNNLAGVPSIVFGVFGLGFFVYTLGGSIDQLFFAEALPTPTFGTGGILWASLTLALLTVPVVIVAAEEGLAAVPRIVREGSLALGATRFETIWKVVVPAAAPGILTGMILAMARAAGEVAPLMIVGVVKLAPALPLDGHFPYVHLERKFMHLGFHIYDLGFQSPNVEATRPLVFATSLLLVGVVVAMNLLAIWIRNHLRRKYAGSAV